MSGTQTSAQPARATLAPTVTTLSPTSGGSIVDTAGNIWTLTASGSVDENGSAVPGGGGTVALTYVNNVIWGEDATTSQWYSYNSGIWVGPVASPPASGPTPTPSPNDTVVTGSAKAITDASGNKWTINGSGQVAINGVADATTAGVIELAYVNGTIWQENNSKLWWGKTGPNASWSPTMGTATSPLPVPIPPAPSNALVIMPLGDSITAGGGTAYNGGAPPGSYRAPLYTGLTDAGYTVQYVGNQTTDPGGGLPTTEDNHEGIGGYSIETVGGDTSNPGLLNYIQDNNILETYKPNMILLQIGYNNMYVAAPENVGPAQAFAFLQQMVTYVLQTLPSVKLVVSTLPATSGDTGIPTADPNSSSELGYYNYLILNKLAAMIDNPNLSIVDINGAEQGYTGAGGVSSLIGPDGIHPSVAGYQVIADTMQAGIERLAKPGSNPAPAPIVSANDTTVTGTTKAIIDGSGNKWTITGDGQIAINGVADTTTAGVIELAYVNGTIWQENNSKLWWDKTKPSASWSPTMGTATSPLPKLLTATATATPPPSSAITVASDTATVTASQVSVVATAGDHMVYIKGSEDVVSLFGGADTITDTGSANTYILPAAGKGSDTFTSDILTTGARLNLKTALAGTNWAASASTLPKYLTVADAANGVALSIAATSGGAGVVIATIVHAPTASLSTLLPYLIT